MRPGTGTGDDDHEQSPSEAAPPNPRRGQPPGQRRQRNVVAIACGAMLVALASGAIAFRGSSLRSYWRSELRSQDPKRATTAADELRRLGAVSALPDLLSAAVRHDPGHTWGREEIRHPAEGIYQACGNLARRDDALPHLIRASRSGEWRVRSLAALHLSGARSMREERLGRLRELAADPEGDVADTARFAIQLLRGEERSRAGSP